MMIRNLATIDPVETTKNINSDLRSFALKTLKLPRHNRPDVRRLQQLLDSLSRVGRLTLEAVDPNGLRLTEPCGVDGFCRQANQNPNMAQYCLQSKNFGRSQSLASGKRFACFCPFGFLEMTVPIVIDDVSVGAIILGQIRCSNAPPGLVTLNTFGPQITEILADPILKAFHDAAPARDYRELTDLIALLEVVVPPIFSSPKEPSDISAASVQLLESPETQLGGAGFFKLNNAFLINAVSSLANLAVLEKAWKTNHMAILLADYLKSADSGQAKQYRSLEDEWADVERYLAMQQLRYGDLLSYRLELPPTLGALKIPTDVLLPAVERAVFFGLASGGDRLVVTISAKRLGPEIMVEVRDNLTSATMPIDDLRTIPFRNGSELKSIVCRMQSARERLSRLLGRTAGPDFFPAASGGTLCRLHIGVQNNSPLPGQDATAV
ncbi:MAG: PocR ligand-binding domain-containing protein [Deltaproteobacteria bacterium]|jgi:ligand-binding sensor protein|nr:PocR ligand-binding domain-containing protein [Deltaproteobacteria bacterium]